MQAIAVPVRPGAPAVGDFDALAGLRTPLTQGWGQNWIGTDLESA